MVASVFGRVRARPTSAPLVEPTPPLDLPPPPDPLAPRPGARRVVRWCEVLAVLERRCQRCHTSPPQVGAPFPLLTFEDTRREYPLGSGQPLVTRMAHAIRYRIMPPTSMPLEPEVLPLEQDEVDQVLVWLEEGALPFGGTDCIAKEAPSARPPSG